MVNNMTSLKNKDRLFWVLITFFAVAAILRYFNRTITEYNTTLFAMSYKYGFISRGLLGTIWDGLNQIFPWDMLTYNHIYYFTIIMTIVLFIVIFAMYRCILSKCDDSKKTNVKYLIIFLSIFLFPMFLTEEVFGRLDLYLYILTFLGIILLLKEKAEWLIVPIVTICMCVHQGYVLTCANMLFVLLIYKCLVNKKLRRKYTMILVISLLVMGVLFVYFEFFSHGAGANYYEEVVNNAKALSEDGESYNTSIVDHEILGKNVYNDEWQERANNKKEFPFFLICFIPYILIALFFFGNLLKNTYFKKDMGLSIGSTEHNLRSVGRIIFVLGGLTVIPQMILKVDYGRYVFMTFSYYIILTICLMIEGDDLVERQLSETKELIKDKTPFPLFVFVYALLYMPLHDVIISGGTYRVATWFDWLR